MKLTRLLSLILAAGLQVMPFLRGALPVQAQGIAPSAWAIVLRLATGAVTLLGYHAVSAATAIVTPYSVSGTVGTPVTRQLGTSGQTAHSWSTTTAALGSSSFPLCPGLTLSKSGFISGTPTQAGTSTFTISAWENSNNTGASTSALFTFTIAGGTVSPPTITVPLANQTAAAGANATFTVTAGGTAPLSYKWLFGTTTLAGATSASMILTNAQAAAAGTYSVVVSNAGGSVTNAATLTVVMPPVIVTPPQGLIVMAGTNITLTVSASGSAAAYQWTTNGSPIPTATGSSLSLTAVGTNQSGTYLVTVSNLAGKVQASARLLVVAPVSTNVAPKIASAVTPGHMTLGFTASPGYRYLVQYNDTLGSTNWVTLTNIAPAFDSSSIQVPQSFSGSAQRFYRTLISNN